MFQRLQTNIDFNGLDDNIRDYKIYKTYKNFKMIGNQISMIIYECIRIQSDSQYIAIKLPPQQKFNQMTQSVNFDQIHSVDKINKAKLGNLLHPENIFHEIDCTFLTQQLCLKQFQLGKCIRNIKTFPIQEARLLITQLSVTLQEFERRGFPKYNLNLSTLYIIENMLFLNILDFDFGNDNTNQFELFKTFVKQYFPTLSQYCVKGFKQTSENLLNETSLNEDFEGSNFFSYLIKILGLTQIQQFPCNSNSLLFVASSPYIFKIYPSVRDEIVIKTPRFIDQEIEQTEYQMLQADRELDINEELSGSNLFAVLVVYFRIQDVNFFFYPKYPGTLADFFQTATQEQIKRVQYGFAYQFAKSLQKLHQLQIMHRDIKPHNVFITSSQFERANLRIADFDRSRKVDDFFEFQSSTDLTHHSSTYDYDPPEAGTNDYNFSSDIWQFGLTLFQMANYGKYPLQKNTLVLMPEDYERINLEFIKNTLSPLGQNDKYIKLISQCLETERNQRITLSKFIAELKNIRIDNEEVDSVVGENDDSFQDQSTENLDQSINWSNLQSRTARSPEWRLSELTQSQGDNFTFDQ